jgi:hypothetical protein
LVKGSGFDATIVVGDAVRDQRPAPVALASWG